MKVWVVERSCFFAGIVLVLAPMIGAFLTFIVAAIVAAAVMPNSMGGQWIVAGPLGAPVFGFPAAFASLILTYELSDRGRLNPAVGLLIGALTSTVWGLVLVVWAGPSLTQGRQDYVVIMLAFFAGTGALSALVAMGFAYAAEAFVRVGPHIAAPPMGENQVQHHAATTGKRPLSHIGATLGAHDEERRQRGL